MVIRQLFVTELTIHPIWKKSVEQPNGNSVNSHQIAIRPITLKLKRKWNLRYCKLIWIAKLDCKIEVVI